ncbi:hypothetical protein BVE79_11345 [Salmonella enterica]|nr:hypothetical protein [Salmonella enterica subsp. enterica]EAM8688312.1 hypothetical protein [Salmonella enterica]EBH8443478.1 hypothetical protein [Salmonella enterica subsp. enterica serovar Ouakam]EBW8615056.1 hypothetical protein [Salmonella enterica subsp. enterica serovar Enteritidis]EBY7288470.1 hypothetical protein [Salmonella enterica subsp. enterica serovar Concord]MMF30749.1 hypothetical protein [Salmonella enterica subsp. enterica serovar Bonn]
MHLRFGSHSYPFRMCFRHRADAGYFLQPIRFRIGSVYADYICSRCRTYGYVLPIPSSLFLRQDQKRQKRIF